MGPFLALGVWLANWDHWDWMAMGLLLLLLELFGTAGFLLWIGLSAFVVGLLLWLLPFGWQAQWLLFSLLAGLSTWLWWRYQHRRDTRDDAARTLNQRMARYLGRETSLLAPVENGLSRIRLDDSFWPVRCEQPLPQGSRVRVIAADSIYLTVEAVESEPKAQTWEG